MTQKTEAKRNTFEGGRKVSMESERGKLGQKEATVGWRVMRKEKREKKKDKVIKRK